MENNIKDYFGNNFKLLPKSYKNLINRFDCMCFDFLVGYHSIFGNVIKIGEKEYYITDVLDKEENSISKKYDIVPFFSEKGYYEWCFNFEINFGLLKKGKPTILLYSCQSIFCECMSKFVKIFPESTKGTNDIYGITINTNLTFDEFMLKLKR